MNDSEQLPDASIRSIVPDPGGHDVVTAAPLTGTAPYFDSCDWGSS
ncbi:hypothetical protein ACIREO_22855 [Streptomyces sp. NPDC102441]